MFSGLRPKATKSPYLQGINKNVYIGTMGSHIRGISGLGKTGKMVYRVYRDHGELCMGYVRLR